MLKVNNGITRKSCEICSIKTQEQRHVHFEQLFVCLNLVCLALYEVAFLTYKKKQFYVHKNSTVKKSKIYFLKMN